MKNLFLSFVLILIFLSGCSSPIITSTQGEPYQQGWTDTQSEPEPEPEPPPFIPPFLTLKSLPKDIIKSNFSNIFIYNTLGVLAKCSDVKDIIITNDEAFATAQIPLVYTANNNEYFYESGSFIITFTISIDALTHITISKADNLIIKFQNGCGLYNLADIPEPVKREWSFIIYMAADNDLESAAIADFNELEAVQLKNVPINILVLLDRSPYYDMTNGNWSGTRLYEINTDPDGLSAIIKSTRLDCPELGINKDTDTELNTADPLVLSMLIDFVKRAYPADNYALFMWGHGTGWRGGIQNDLNQSLLKAVAIDDTHNQFMSLPSFGKAIKGKGLSVIGFDTCYAAILEVAYQVRNDAMLLVGSEGPIPSTGWNYTELFTDLLKNPSLSIANLGNSIQMQFSKQYSGISNATISQIDLTKVENLFIKFENFTGAVANAITTSTARNVVLNQIMQNVESYYFTSFPSDLYIDIFDFSQKINNIRTSITTNSTAQSSINSAANDLNNALSDALPSSWAKNGTTKKIGVHVIPLMNVGVPSVSHESAYIKGSMNLDKSDFVENSSHWVPNFNPKNDSLLDKLFYWVY